MARRITVIAGALVVATGAGVLIAWAAGVEALTGFGTGRLIMLPNTALAFLAGGLSLLLQFRPTHPRWLLIAGRLLGALAFSIGAGTLIERTLDLTSPLDLVLFGDAVKRYPYLPPGQMAINSTVAFSCLGAALAFMDVRTRGGRRPAELLTLAALAIAFLALVGYGFGVRQLYTFDAAAGMALITALSFFTLGTGVFVARPESGAASLLVGDDAGAVVARRLIPGAIALPLTLGWFWLYARQEALIGREAGISTFVVAIVIGGLALVLRSAQQARASDGERQLLLARERVARAQAEAANEAKMQFLANMSHELRTPLNAIAGYAELIELGVHGPVTDDQRDALGRLRRAQHHLLALINDILNYAKVDAGRIELAIDDVPLYPLLAEIDTLIDPQLRARSLRFELIPCDAELMVRADVEKLRQILLNLLANAVKFTEPGGSITVSCSVASTPAGETVGIHVQDTGIGIPTEKLSSIFDPFVQLERTLTSGHEGAGLGLAISRDLARAMSGELTVTSEIGVGSRFTLTLPRGGVTRAVTPERVLLVHSGKPQRHYS